MQGLINDSILEKNIISEVNFWKSLDIDYQKLAEETMEMGKKFSVSDNISFKTDLGSDFYFKVEKIACECGSFTDSPFQSPIINIPGGEILLIPQKDSIKYSADPVICFGEDARLEVNGGEIYHWNNGDIMSSTTVHPVANSDYSVTVTDKYGSEHIHVYHVTIDKECTAVSVPSAFTPNADGNNDIFRAYGENIASFNMQIMNRQGQLLFSSTDINQGWDGMFNGELQPAQVYVYTIIYTNGRGEQNIKKGQFTLLR